jgi:hypothetical protein
MAEPAKGRVRVKVLPKDPLVARRDGLWPVTEELPCATPGSGPTGPHAVVVDYNADLDTRFAPVRLLKSRSFEGIAQLSDSKILDDFHFHQVNVWAIVERTLGLIEDKYAMARAIPWASQLGRLILIPHAGYDENAFYDRGTGALHFFYFEGPDGKPVYTCLSHDIVAHELGHAVLDGLKPYYNEVCSPETAGFHEYFGDAMAMMASLSRREIALLVTRRAPSRLSAQNVVSAIASEFGAALHGLEDHAYLRGAWHKRKMSSLRGSYEEHDWSEVLTGVYYELLQYLYAQNLKELKKEGKPKKTKGDAQYFAMRAIIRAATVTSAVMFRGLDYCPPVDLRYDEYARAVLRADEVAYPDDSFGIRDRLRKAFAARGLRTLPTDYQKISDVQMKLRGVEIDEVAATPADAYRFLDAYRELFAIPYDVNFCVPSVYRTSKLSKDGYRPPKEQIIEYVWTEDVELSGARFGPLKGSLLPLFCGGTLVFDSNGNFLHQSIVTPSPRRRRELKNYAAYLVREGELAVADGLRGIGAPGVGSARVRATIEGGRARLVRNAAMRHARRERHT